ncbi:hypothetical protein B0T24DRAFT_304649 [Lasiosphaeria ovina]|uniref:Uncharacterized protein n=1 Tax=Lasiosphaeria ovina TaxID=92902 RepID=A0AAE0K7T2_9PEZI|nr:hypothetical protein B0T24DRAFT_304649 [Lasiosphaeria ovina]
MASSSSSQPPGIVPSWAKPRLELAITPALSPPEFDGDDLNLFNDRRQIIRELVWKILSLDGFFIQNPSAGTLLFDAYIAPHMPRVIQTNIWYAKARRVVVSRLWDLDDFSEWVYSNHVVPARAAGEIDDASWDNIQAFRTFGGNWSAVQREAQRDPNGPLPLFDAGGELAAELLRGDNMPRSSEAYDERERQRADTRDRRRRHRR